MKAPEICVLKTQGTNCDMEMQYAFEVAGGKADIVHVNEFHIGNKKLSEYSGLGIPGGFSYGDDIASGAVWANELVAFYGDEMTAFIEKDRPILGICNGFPVMTRAGLLPAGNIGEQTGTLAHNDSGHFTCKWVDLEVMSSICRFAPPAEFGHDVPMQVAHGEGRFEAPSEALLDEMEQKGQLVFTYHQNPNGSARDIAGICDPSGTALGMMPHPERSISSMHPDRTRTAAAKTAAEVIFKNFVSYAAEV